MRAISLVIALIFSFMVSAEDLGGLFQIREDIGSEVTTFLDQSQKSLAQKKAIFGEIGSYLKSALEDIHGEKLAKLMRDQYYQMWLIDDLGQWTLPKFEKYQSFLLPSLTQKDVNNFIDEMVVANSKNDYLVAFLGSLTTAQKLRIKAKFDQDAKSFFPDILAHALVTNLFTKTIRADYTLLTDAIEMWDKIVKRDSLLDRLDLGYLVKYYSVRSPINKMIEVFKSNRVPNNFLRQMIGINILEAGLVDKFCDFDDNWEAGKILASYKPYGEEAQRLLGKNAVANFGKDSKGIALNFPLSDKWADLYIAWQLGFLSQYESYPYDFVKMLIPQVANHYDDSREFIFNRGVALYTSIYFSQLGRVPHNEMLSSKMNWLDEDITKQWGLINLANAHNYEFEVRRAIEKKETGY